MIFYQFFKVNYSTSQKLSELKLIQISDQMFKDLLMFFQHFIKTLKQKSHVCYLKFLNEAEEKKISATQIISDCVSS